MNAALITACAINGSRHKQNAPIYFSAYMPKPRPEYAVAVSIKQTKNTSIVHQYIPDDVQIRFKGEIGLVELDELIYDLIEARDELKKSIRGD